MKISMIALIAALFLSSPVAGFAQTAMPADSPPASGALPRLVITPDVIAGLPRRTISVALENGGRAAYAGVDVGALLAKNGAPHGHALRGKAATDYVVVTATDGYRVVFALAETDAELTDKIVLLADERDGKPLEPHDGPFQVIVPDEKHHVRWIRNVREIDVEPLP